jgi:hypothetical protein
MKKQMLVMVATLSLALSAVSQTVETALDGLWEPYGIAVDTSQTNNFYYITDSMNHRILRLEPATGKLWVVLFSPTELPCPQGIVLARGGLVVADAADHSVKLVIPGGTVTCLAGSAAGNVTLNAPSGLAVDGAGNIFIADTGNNVVRQLRPDNTVVTYATGFKWPTGLAMDEGGRLFVADTGNHVVKLVQPGGAPVQVVAGRVGSTFEFTDLNSPRGLLWLGGEAGLLISDTGNHVLRRLGDLSFTYGGTYKVSGADNGPADKAKFFEPVGLAADLNGAILVADLKNGMVRRITRPALTSLSVAPPTGSYSNAVTITATSLVQTVTFRYTTNGLDPTLTSPLLGSTLILDGGPEVPFKLRAFSPDWGASAVLSNNYAFFVNPLTNSVPGGTYQNDFDLGISTLTDKAVIRCTTDGTAPTNAGPSISPQWSDHPINGDVSLRAVGFKYGYKPTAEIKLDYKFEVALPKLTPAATVTTNNPVKVSFECGTTNADLIWTIDGSEPALNNGLRYDGTPFFLTTNGLLSLKAFKTGYKDSLMVTNLFSYKAATPVVSPSGATANNSVRVTMSSDTRNADIYYTSDGSLPGPSNSASKLYGNAAFDLEQTGTLTARAFYQGFVPSDLSTNAFTLKVADVIISPKGATVNDVLEVTLSSSTRNAKFRWTIDGSEPSPTKGNEVVDNPGKFTLTSNGQLKVVAYRDGFADSAVAEANFNLKVSNPVVVTPNSLSLFTNKVQVSLKLDSPEAVLHYTIDGSDPNPGVNTTAVRQDEFATKFPILIEANTTIKAVGVRDGFANSEVVTRQIDIKVPKPIMNPDIGFFPDGTDVTLTLSEPRADATIYYTLDGQEPKPDAVNAFKYTKPFSVNMLNARGFDLRAVKARAFAPNTIPSDIVGGRATDQNLIGVARKRIYGGVGSTIVVPVVVNLRAGAALESLQYKIFAVPNGATPPLTADLESLDVNTNLFQPVVVGAKEAAKPVLYWPVAYTQTMTNDVGTSVPARVMEMLFGPASNLRIVDFGTVQMMALSIPAAATEGDSYSLQVAYPSGTSDGGQQVLPLTAMNTAENPVTIVVTNIAYTVGDTSPGIWYNAGDFGNGDLDNADVNNVLNATLGYRLPYHFSDAFDAMDVFPEDSSDAVGGDGQIRYLDLARVLQRSLRRLTNNWQRSWTATGVRMAQATTLELRPMLPAESSAAGTVVTGRVWPDAEVLAQHVGDAQPGQRVKVPVYVHLVGGERLEGLQFKAIVRPEANAPALTEAIGFVAAEALPAPVQPRGLPYDQVGNLWTPLWNPFAQPLTQRAKVGTVEFTVPAGAQRGQSYIVDIENADGAPDLNTQYDLTANRAVVTVGEPVNPPVQPTGARGFKLRWQAPLGRQFVVESKPNLASGNWRVEAELVGRGRVQEYLDGKLTDRTKFYRVRPKE